MDPADALLSDAAHRPWPIPPRPWLWSQHWLELLFAHYRVSADTIQRQLPPGLEVDTRDGSAWVSVVPFRMAHVRPRHLPAVPPISNFLELNFRTYVVRDDRPGVYFLSIHAGNRLAAWLSRSLSPLPYAYVPMTTTHSGSTATFRSDRTDGQPLCAADFTPLGSPASTAPGSLDEWLTERYCLYVPSRGRLLRGEVHHARWQVRPAKVRIDAAALGKHHGIDLNRPPEFAHCSPGVHALAWSCAGEAH